MKREMNISNAESILYGLLKGKVSANTFVGTLPDTTKSTWNDMVLIDTSSSIADYNAFSNGIVFIWLYARPMKSGNKNVKVLYEMENKLDSVIKSNADPRFMVSRRNTYSDYDTQRKWHCNIVELNITLV